MNNGNKKVLWISPYAPYDKITHAGGKVENYYVKNLNRAENIELHLISCAVSQEICKLDLEQYKISHTLCITDKSTLYWILKKIFNLESTINPFNRNGRLLQNWMEYLLKKAIADYAEKKGDPDIVVLQWTACVFLTEYVKAKFPASKVVGIEEDVTFQAYGRKVGNLSGISKFTKRMEYNIIKKKELRMLKQVDLVWTYTEKDRQLLTDNGIRESKIDVFVSYYEDYSEVKYTGEDNYLVYYGNMGRKENYGAVLWMIREILPKLPDSDIKLVVIGANPAKELLDEVSDRVEIVGYVDSPEQYFAQATCMVIPLLEGAGIKVKILEAMSAGVPVLTNEIGIEGIPAVDGKEYLLCKDAEDYVKAIMKLIKRKELRESISKAEKNFMRNHFDRQKSLQKVIDIFSRMTFC